jgi:hypothetical protein
MNRYSCEICGGVIEEDEIICFDCEDKERKWDKNAKKSRVLRQLDGRKDTHRTKKRNTHPRKNEHGDDN